MSSAVKSPSFIFEGAPLAFAPGQSVLEALEGAGAQVESSCRAGVCQSCLLACVTGDIPVAAQAGLTPAQKRQGLFTSCQCPADEALVIVRPGVARGRAEAEVVDLDWLTDSVVRLRLKPLTPFPFAPGQFLNLGRDGVTRSYSIASTPDQGAQDAAWSWRGPAPGWRRCGPSCTAPCTPGTGGPSSCCMARPRRTACIWPKSSRPSTSGGTTSAICRASAPTWTDEAIC